jgi:hypothetical protein
MFEVMEATASQVFSVCFAVHGLIGRHLLRPPRFLGPEKILNKPDQRIEHNNGGIRLIFFSPTATEIIVCDRNRRIMTSVNWWSRNEPVSSV